MEETMHARFNAPELVPELQEISAALFKATGNGAVPPVTVALIGLRACQITGNTYTLVQQARPLRKLGESEDRIDALASWWGRALFHRRRASRPGPAGGCAPAG